MHRILHHLFSFSLAGVLFVSTLGLPVHSLYCLCKGETSVFVFGDDNAIGCHAEESATCCQVEPVSCCSASSACSDPSEDHSCETEEVSFVKLDLVYFQGGNLDQGSDLEVTSPCLPLAYGPTLPVEILAQGIFIPVDPPFLRGHGQPLWLQYAQVRC